MDHFPKDMNFNSVMKSMFSFSYHCCHIPGKAKNFEVIINGKQQIILKVSIYGLHKFIKSMLKHSDLTEKHLPSKQIYIIHIGILRSISRVSIYWFLLHICDLSPV